MVQDGLQATASEQPYPYCQVSASVYRQVEVCDGTATGARLYAIAHLYLPVVHVVNKTKTNMVGIDRARARAPSC